MTPKNDQSTDFQKSRCGTIFFGFFDCHQWPPAP